MMNTTVMNEMNNATRGMLSAEELTKRNVDFYVADRTLSTRVLEFMECKVWKKEIQLKYAKKIAELEQSVNTLENLRGSVHEDKIPEMRTTLLAQIEEFKIERNDQIKLQANFVDSDADKALKKTLRKVGDAEDLIADAVCEWFDAYGLDIRNTYFLDEILGCFGKKFAFSKFVQSNGTECRALDVPTAVQMIYATAYAHMIHKTIKPVQIPELVREKFAPKTAKKAKKAKKSNK